MCCGSAACGCVVVVLEVAFGEQCSRGSVKFDNEIQVHERVAAQWSVCDVDQWHEDE